MAINKTIFQKFRSHACVKPLNNGIKIKTDRDIEMELGIKVEKSHTSRNTTNNTPQVSIGMSSTDPTSSIVQAELLPNEKKKLIDNILSLKSENQALVQKLNEKDAALKVSKKLLQEKVLGLTLKLDESKAELKNMSQANEKIVADLKRENQLLTAQYKQLNAGLNQTENADESKSDIYEVESLLSHKTVNELFLLIRWKGFDETYDTWERESNLNCSSMLKKYKKLNKLK